MPVLDMPALPTIKDTLVRYYLTAAYRRAAAVNYNKPTDCRRVYRHTRIIREETG